jgi:hypothetical protein
MPNFHVEHAIKTDRRCDMGLPVIEMCRAQLVESLAYALMLGFVVGFIVYHYTK